LFWAAFWRNFGGKKKHWVQDERWGAERRWRRRKSLWNFATKLLVITHKGHPTPHHLAPRETQKSTVHGVQLTFLSLKTFQNTHKTYKSGFLHGEIIILSIT
jgi:hypothetical protein